MNSQENTQWRISTNVLSSIRQKS